MSLQPETVECLSFDPLFVVPYHTDNMSWGLVKQRIDCEGNIVELSIAVL
ncbi:MAG: hypothetical protein OEV34_19050 [Gammaproteobacteria bacterium]|nr:hypothetical protein [Gammaproteobacteria bacterium]